MTMKNVGSIPDVVSQFTFYKKKNEFMAHFLYI